MLVHDAFLFKLVEATVDHDHKRLALPIIRHLCWCNRSASEELIKVVRSALHLFVNRPVPYHLTSSALVPSFLFSFLQVKSGIEKLDGPQLKPFFNVLGTLLEMDDDETLAVRRPPTQLACAALALPPLPLLAYSLNIPGLCLPLSPSVRAPP